jgi:transcriptional regulator of aromatic amino acid metabolism
MRISSISLGLILGETETGKELIACAIHRMSARKDGSFIKLNCGGIPTELLESDFCGHEKGAFTGAISAKIGRLELADQGTLFWMRSETFRWSCSPSYCGCCRIRNLRGWAGFEPSK